MQRYITTFQEFANSGLYDLEELCERSGVLEIRLCLLNSVSNRLVISFSSHLGFRKAGESEGLVALDAIATTSSPGRSFYVVEDSDYVRWLVEQSHGIQKPELLTQYTIVTVDDIIDVIALDPPSVFVPP
jgi:hypothetical protein